MVFPQGPYDPAPAPEDMAAPGQRLLAAGDHHGRAFVDLAYQHDNVIWHQRHTICANGWIVTAQAPDTHADTTFDLRNELAEQLGG